MERYVVEGSALRPANNAGGDTYLLKDWLINIINMPLSEESIYSVMMARNVPIDKLFAESEDRERDLCKADLLVLLVTSPTKLDNQTEKDNGWSSTHGGYTLSEKDKSLFLRMANALYEKYDEPQVLAPKKVKVKIHNYGIKPRNREPWENW